MIRKDKILTTLFGVIALSSCSSLNQNEKEIALKPELKVKRADYDVNKEIGNDLLENETEKTSFINIKPELFTLSGTDFMYDGEKIYSGEEVKPNVVVTELSVKNPTVVYSEEDPRYKEFLTNKEKNATKYEVEEITGESLTPFERTKFENIGDRRLGGASEILNAKKYIRVKFKGNDTKYLHVKIKNVKTGEEAEIALNKKLKLLQRLGIEIKDYTRYEDLKKTNGSRVSYSVSTLDGGVEDIEKDYGEDYNTYYNKTKKFFDYDSYFSPKKYEDLDDLAGVKRVSVRQHIDGIDDIEDYRLISFGDKLFDFKDDYSKLLSDLSKTPIKFKDESREEIEGGFDPYLVILLVKGM